jgi:hypothetical protein
MTLSEISTFSPLFLEFHWTNKNQMKEFEVNIKDKMIGGHAYVKFSTHCIPSEIKISFLNSRFVPEIKKYNRPKSNEVPSFKEIEIDDFMEYLDWNSSFPGFSCPELTKYVQEFLEDKQCKFYKDETVNSVCIDEFHGLIIHEKDALEVYYQYCD